MQIIQHIKHDQIDFKKWDSTVLNSKLPFVFAQSFYLNATSPGWDALIINDYESVFPLTHKSKFGIHYLPQPPFTSQLGVYGKTNNEIDQLFYNYVTNKFKLIELEWNSGNSISNEFIKSKNTFVIDYNEEYQFNQNTRRNIQKAIDLNLKVIEVAKNEIVSLSKKYLYPFLKNELSLSVKSISLFEQLLKNAQQENQLISFQVIDEKGNCKALAHFIFNDFHAFFLKGTVINKKENSGSMHLLLKYAMEFFSDKAKLFDFGGGSNSESLAGFYKGLGGKKLNYGFLQWNQLPALLNIFKRCV
jgi:hypothetical protein